jgi:hypothetical protein
MLGVIRPESQQLRFPATAAQIQRIVGNSLRFSDSEC